MSTGLRSIGLRLLLCWRVSAAGLHSQRLRVVSWNVHAFRDSNHRDNFDRVTRTLAELEPDVVLLNEVLHPYAGGDAAYFARVADGRGRGWEPPAGATPAADAAECYLHRLSAALGLRHVAFAEAERDDCFFGRFGFGNALLSRTPLAARGELALRARAGDELLGDQARDFVEGRSMVWGRVALAGGATVTLAAAHFDHKAEPVRAKQAAACAAELARAAAEPGGLGRALLAGDLNAFERRDHDDAAWRAIVEFYASRGWGAPAETSAALETLRDAGFVDARASAADAADGLGPTCWTHRPLFRIDHALLSPALAACAEVVRYARVLDDASDHYAICVDLEFPVDSTGDPDRS